MAKFIFMKLTHLSLKAALTLIILFCLTDARVLEQSASANFNNFQEPGVRNPLPGNPGISERGFYDGIHAKKEQELRSLRESHKSRASSLRPLNIRFNRGANTQLAIQNLPGRRIHIRLGNQQGTRQVRLNFGQPDNTLDHVKKGELNNFSGRLFQERQLPRNRLVFLRNAPGSTRRRVMLRSTAPGEPRRLIVKTRGAARIHLSSGSQAGRKHIVIRRSRLQQAMNDAQKYVLPANDRLSEINGRLENEQLNNNINIFQRKDGSQRDFNDAQSGIVSNFNIQSKLEMPGISETSIDNFIKKFVRSLSKFQISSLKGNQNDVTTTTDAPEVEVEEAP